MAEDLAGLFVALGLCAVACDALWTFVSYLLDPFRPKPPAPAAAPRFRTFEPGRITVHGDGTITVEEIETTYLRRRPNGG